MEERAKAKAAKEQERACAKAAREAQKHAKSIAQEEKRALKAQPELKPKPQGRKRSNTAPQGGKVLKKVKMVTSTGRIVYESQLLRVSL